MKKFFFLAAAFVTGLAATAQQKADDLITVKNDNYNFGKIQQGKPVSLFFEITNKSKMPVVIENAYAGCGCTTPEVPKEPIAPGATAKLKVEYNAAAVAPFTKDVTVKLAGVAEPKVLYFTGEVLSEEAWAAYVKSDEYKKAQKGKGAKTMKK